VRLLDCWAPERNTPEGKKAAAKLVEFAGGEPVVLHVPTAQAHNMADVLTFGRVVGEVWLGGINLSDWMVEHGHAKATKRGTA
jgi:endonuclease YncB( thermonuclease family)